MIASALVHVGLGVVFGVMLGVLAFAYWLVRQSRRRRRWKAPTTEWRAFKILCDEIARACEQVRT